MSLDMKQKYDKWYKLYDINFMTSGSFDKIKINIKYGIHINKK